MSPLNFRPASMQRPPPMEEEQKRAIARRDEPKQHVDEVDPDRVLHALDAAVALRFLVDVQLAENAEDCCPEDTAPLKISSPLNPYRTRRSVSRKTYKSITSQMKKIHVLINGIR